MNRIKLLVTVCLLVVMGLSASARADRPEPEISGVPPAVECGEGGQRWELRPFEVEIGFAQARMRPHWEGAVLEHGQPGVWSFDGLTMDYAESLPGFCRCTPGSDTRDCTRGELNVWVEAGQLWMRQANGCRRFYGGEWDRWLVHNRFPYVRSSNSFDLDTNAPFTLTTTICFDFLGECGSGMSLMTRDGPLFQVWGDWRGVKVRLSEEEVVTLPPEPGCHDIVLTYAGPEWAYTVQVDNTRWTVGARLKPSDRPWIEFGSLPPAIFDKLEWDFEPLPPGTWTAFHTPGFTLQGHMWKVLAD